MTIALERNRLIRKALHKFPKKLDAAKALGISVRTIAREIALLKKEKNHDTN